MINILRVLGYTLGLLLLVVIVSGGIIWGIDFIQISFNLTNIQMVWGLSTFLFIILFSFIYNINDKKHLKTIPVVMWRFCAYKTEKDYESGEHYFIKDFLDHTEMKVFSGEHSAKEKPLHHDYCSMYWKIETIK